MKSTISKGWHAGMGVIVCLAMSLLSGGAAAGADHLNGLASKAFTDPSLQTAMPEEWINKSIVYEKEAEDAQLTIVLDQDIYHTFSSIIEEFSRINNLKIFAKEGTCGIAAGMLSRKSTDMGGFCCPPGKEDRLPGVMFHTIGIVAKAILVNKENPIDNVSIDQAKDIFRGKISRWSQLQTEGGGQGPNWPIMTIGRFHCKARPGHWYLLLPDEKLFGPMLHEVGSIPDMITQVGASRGAVGWEVLSMVEHYQGQDKIKALKINGHPPTDKEALATKNYPLYRTYNVTTWEGDKVMNVQAQRLVAYLMQEAEHIDSRFGFVPAAGLKGAGWKFTGDELVGEPQ